MLCSQDRQSASWGVCIDRAEVWIVLDCQSRGSMWLREKGWLNFRPGPVKRLYESRCYSSESTRLGNAPVDTCDCNPALAITRRLSFETSSIVWSFATLRDESTGPPLRNRDGHPVPLDQQLSTATTATTIRSHTNNSE
jgi:hypothetical protein